MSVVLYNKNGHPVICERPNWKRCPEHKHLSEKMPKNNKAVLEDRTKPPYVLTIEEDGSGSVTLLDTNGDLYWKQYDSYGAGVGSSKISGVAKMFYSKKIKKAVAEAWEAYDKANNGTDYKEYFNE